jgi:lysophospholipid acyltransferase (LPLAT)-like uncharacterized protein
VARRTPSLPRRLIRSLAGSKAAAGLISRYIWLVARTTRWTVTGRDGWDALVARPEGFVCTTWHGRLFLSPVYAPPGKRAVAMISASRDGDLIAAIVGRWGVAAVRGSSDDPARHKAKGGAQAFVAAARELNANGALIAITPDGPRGPRMRAQAGLAQLACSQGVAVIAVGFSVRWGRHLASWDRFLLPLPFGRGAIVYSEPRWPPEDISRQALARFGEALEVDLNEVTNRADDICGRPRVLPAEEVV